MLALLSSVFYYVLKHRQQLSENRFFQNSSASKTRAVTTSTQSIHMQKKSSIMSAGWTSAKLGMGPTMLKPGIGIEEENFHRVKLSCLSVKYKLVQALSSAVMSTEEENWRGYEWVALSVTTVGALLASIQGSALLIALPDIMTRASCRIHDNQMGDSRLHAHRHCLGTRCGASGRHVWPKEPLQRRLCSLHVGLSLLRPLSASVSGLGPSVIPYDPGIGRCPALHQQRSHRHRCLSQRAGGPRPGSEHHRLFRWLSMGRSLEAFSRPLTGEWSS